METRFDAAECKVIMTILEAGSFSGAASELHYTQSGITHMMCRLEESLGFKLWQRKKNGVELTKEGEELLPLVRRLLECYDELNSLADKYAVKTE